MESTAVLHKKAHWHLPYGNPLSKASLPKAQMQRKSPGPSLAVLYEPGYQEPKVE